MQHGCELRGSSPEARPPGCNRDARLENPQYENEQARRGLLPIFDQSGHDRLWPVKA
jgi:hypothetical protein